VFVVCAALSAGYQKWTVLAIPNGKDLTEDLRGKDQRERKFDIGYDEMEGSNQNAAYWSF
jgi:hypothetical protein